MKLALRDRIAGGETVIGGWLAVPSPLVAEAMASLGFDWIAVDLEHGTMNVDQAAAAFLACERHGVAPFARLPSADPIIARRLLDNGAVGLIIPVIESADAFADFARHCFYHPDGRRGVGLSRCNLWGDTFDSYREGFRPFLVPQIETKAGIDAAAKIAALNEVDALFIGPYDLAASLGNPGDFTTSAFRDALNTFRSACRAHRKPAGFHQVEPDAAALEHRIEEGYQFVAFGTDIIAMRHALKAVRERAKGLRW